MKNLGFLLSFLLLATLSNAQLRTFYGAASVTAGTTGYDTLKTSGVIRSLSIQAVVTKTSGTVAGTVSLEGSNDGINFSSISATTLTLADVATQNIIWSFGPWPFPYCRVKFVNTTGVFAPVVTGAIRQ